MHRIQVRDLSIAYVDTGRGESVVLAHCSSASHRVWRALAERLAERYHVVTPDLIGYGSSDGWPADRPFDPVADANVLAALAEQAGGRVHLVGHSYGGAMALEAARLLGERVASLTLVEPVSFHLLRLAGRDRAWTEISGVSRRVREAVARGRLRRAAAHYMTYWIGWRWLLVPRNVKASIVQSVSKVALEFGAMDEEDVRLADYAGLDTPTRVLLGARTQQATRAVAEVLVDLLPRAEVEEIAGAGHMGPITHREAVNARLVDHIDRHRTGAAGSPVQRVAVRAS